MADVLRGHVIYGFPPTLYFSFLFCFTAFSMLLNTSHIQPVSASRISGELIFPFYFSDCLLYYLFYLPPLPIHRGFQLEGLICMMQQTPLTTSAYPIYSETYLTYPWGTCTQLHVSGGTGDQNTLATVTGYLI